MNVSRRDFLRAAVAVAGALGYELGGDRRARNALALEAEEGGTRVVWLEAQSCTGCSVSLLNSIHYQSIGDLLTAALDLDFHDALMATAGFRAVAEAEKAYRKGDYVLVVEGAIPTGAGGEYCYLWPGLTAQAGVERFATRARHILAVGTCAAFGGVVSAAPNPTGARGLEDEYHGKRVIRIPGCPTHPDWIVGTVAYLMANGEAPDLDDYGRPLEFFGERIHTSCPLRPEAEVTTLGRFGCLQSVGCKGPRTRADCHIRRWNADSGGGLGINWCVGAGSPCIGCTDSDFPDSMSPFYELEDDR